VPAVIEVTGVWKRFRLRGRSVWSAAADLLRPRRRDLPGQGNNFWALEDVSFRVDHGNALALIGANGSGKSTMLKVITGMMAPTRGRVTADERMALLSHLGGGFHGELTGRENVFLQGAVLGLGRKELKSKLSDIFSFAELESFADVPVKFYSSGMTLRLGFSIAAHVDPQVLLIDEALAVGDAAFRDRCLARLLEFRANGVSMLLVSHERYLVEQLCDRAVLLHHGRVRADGPPEEAFTIYERITEADHAGHWAFAVEGDVANAPFTVESVELVGYAAGVVPVVEVDKPLTVRLVLRALRDLKDAVVGMQVAREWQVLHGTRTSRQGITVSASAGEKTTVELEYQRLSLARGSYVLHAVLFDHRLAQTPVVTVKRIAQFRVTHAETEGVGLVRLPHVWRVGSPRS
jgi:ABC-2 type transport system ATP-binding protein